MDIGKELSLPIMAHELGQDATKHGKLRLLPMSDGLEQDAMLMLLQENVLPPGPELLAEV